MLKVGQHIVSNIDGAGLSYPYKGRPLTFSGTIERIQERKLFVRRDDGVLSDLKGNGGLWEIHMQAETTLINPNGGPFIIITDDLKVI